MPIKDKKLPTLGSLLIQKLMDDNLKCFTIDTAYERLSGYKQGTIKKMLSVMVKRGILMRIKEGLYYIIPLEEDPDTFMPDWHLLAKCLMQGSDYYIGYFSAMQLHSLTTQPNLIEQIVVNRQIKPSSLQIKNTRFQFIYHNTKHYFGFQEIWADEYNKVNCSDPEKTIIDGLFHPQKAGGVTEVAKAIHKINRTLDYEKLLLYTKRFGSQAVVKRLGFLLELLEINTEIISKLHEMRSNSFVLLEPSHPPAGTTFYRWAIRRNIDEDSILSSIST